MGMDVARQSPFAFDSSSLDSSKLWLDGISRCLDALWSNCDGGESIAHRLKDAELVSCMNE